jgi:superfamily I DNA/RNA helicase
MSSPPLLFASRTKLTAEQQGILDAARHTTANLIIEARAGAAKTTTLKFISDSLRVPTLCVAFNTRIAEELRDRFPKHTTCATLNSIGHRVWGQSISYKIVFDPKKNNKIITDLGRAHRNNQFDFMVMRNALDFAKERGFVPSDFPYESIIAPDRFYHDLEIKLDRSFGQIDRMLLDDALNRNILMGRRGVIDYGDQLYLPALLGGKFDSYDLILIDEAQDLSPLNHAFLRRLVILPEKRVRLIAVGDPKQGIYGFRNAMPGSMLHMQEEFAMAPLKLTTTFRCAKSIVRVAQKHAPDLNAWENADEGIVDRWGAWGPSMIPAGAFIICRNNAPLYDLGTKLLRSGHNIKVLGTAIGSSLTRDLRALGTDDLPAATAIAILDKFATDKERTTKPENLDDFRDKIESVRVLLRRARVLGDAIAEATRLSSADGKILLLTGHKSKGLESDTVIFLDSWRIPSQFAKNNKDALEQEENLRYVIETRAKRQLYYADLNQFNPQL